jgi:hypothetical protein
MLLIAASCSIGAANAGTFTWDPSKSIPVLAGPGSSFTADTIDIKTYLSSVVQVNGTSAFRQVLPITGFELNGQPVTATGLNSAYGLYFNISGISQMSGGAAAYSNLDISLVADPGNNDGALSATIPAGLAFSNGTAGDIVLGSGALVSASLGLDGAGVRHAHYVETFTPANGQAAFFGNAFPLLDIMLTTPAPNFASVPQPNGTVINLVNGGVGQVTLAPAPEPVSIALLGSGLLGIFLIGRRLRLPGMKDADQVAS